jgi:hypothetical protein
VERNGEGRRKKGSGRENGEISGNGTLFEKKQSRICRVDMPELPQEKTKPTKMTKTGDSVNAVSEKKMG